MAEKKATSVPKCNQPVKILVVHPALHTRNTSTSMKMESLLLLLALRLNMACRSSSSENEGLMYIKFW